MPKQIHVNLFEMNCVSHITHGMWRLPANNRERFNDIEYWTELARLLEYGGFDAVFLADVIGTYDVFRGSAETSIRQGLQIPSNDPSMVVPAMAAVTRHLGFGDHLLDHVRAAVRVGQADEHAGPPHQGPGRLEHRHVLPAERGPQLRPGRRGRPRQALRDRRRVPGRPVQALGGLLGRRRDHRRPGPPRLRRPGQDQADLPRRRPTSGSRARTCPRPAGSGLRCCSSAAASGDGRSSPASTPRRSSWAAAASARSGPLSPTSAGWPASTAAILVTSSSCPEPASSSAATTRKWRRR